MKAEIILKKDPEKFVYEFAEEFDASTFLALASAISMVTTDFDKVFLKVSDLDQDSSSTYAVSYTNDIKGPSEFGPLFYLKHYTIDGLNTMINHDIDAWCALKDDNRGHLVPRIQSKFIHRLHKLGIDLRLSSTEARVIIPPADKSYEKFCEYMNRYIKDNEIVIDYNK